MSRSNDRPKIPRAPVIAALLAGGIGSRFGSEQAKQVLSLSGTPVLAHVFLRFDSHPNVSELVIPAHARWRDEIEAIARSTIIDTPWRLVDAGETRNESVASAVAAIDAPEATVIVHDGARPLVSGALISRAIDAIDGADAVLPVIPSTDPIVMVADGDVTTFVDRRQLRRGQTPQVFRLSTLRAMFEARPGADAGRFSTLFELLLSVRPEAKIRTVPGDEQNLKITLPLDHLIAEQILLVAGDDELASPAILHRANGPSADS